MIHKHNPTSFKSHQPYKDRNVQDLASVSVLFDTPTPQIGVILILDLEVGLRPLEPPIDPPLPNSL